MSWTPRLGRTSIERELVRLTIDNQLDNEYPVIAGSRSQPGRIRANPVPQDSVPRVPPSVNGARHLPPVLSSDEVEALVGALRTWRDRAMVEAILTGGMRRRVVLGLRLRDVCQEEDRVTSAERFAGRPWLIPTSDEFLVSLARYLDEERPESPSDKVFVCLKEPGRGRPLSAAGLDQIVDGARKRAGLRSITCHLLHRTCVARLDDSSTDIRPERGIRPAQPESSRVCKWVDRTGEVRPGRGH